MSLHDTMTGITASNNSGQPSSSENNTPDSTSTMAETVDETLIPLNVKVETIKDVAPEENQVV